MTVKSDLRVGVGGSLNVYVGFHRPAPEASGWWDLNGLCWTSFYFYRTLFYFLALQCWAGARGLAQVRKEQSRGPAAEPLQTGSSVHKFRLRNTLVPKTGSSLAPQLSLNRDGMVSKTTASSTLGYLVVMTTSWVWGRKLTAFFYQHTGVRRPWKLLWEVLFMVSCPLLGRETRFSR